MSSRKSQNIHDKPKFKTRFEQCSQKTQALFMELKDKAIKACGSDDWGYSDTPDLRIGFKYNLILFKPQFDHVLIWLRIDTHSIDTMASELQSLSISEVQVSDRPNQRWIEVEVSSLNQVDEAIRFITTVYNHRKQVGW